MAEDERLTAMHTDCRTFLDVRRFHETGRGRVPSNHRERDHDASQGEKPARRTRRGFDRAVFCGCRGRRRAHGVFTGPRPAEPLRARLAYQERKPLDTGGFLALLTMVDAWLPSATLDQVRDSFGHAGHRAITKLEQAIDRADTSEQRKIVLTFIKASMFNYEGDPGQAYEVAARLRATLETHDALAQEWLYLVIYFQGVTALRRAKTTTASCAAVKARASCPIAPAAVHTKPDGSRLAIKHFTEYLEQFPDDLGVRWLLNVAHMTLGEYPERSIRGYLLVARPLLPFRVRHRQVSRRRPSGRRQPLQPGRRRDHGRFRRRRPARYRRHLDGSRPCRWRFTATGVTAPSKTAAKRRASPANWAGWSATRPTTTTTAVWTSSSRAALASASRCGPACCSNDGDGRFTDVTAEAGLLDPLNSNAAAWADYDNDGWLDLFVAARRQPNQLYRNRGDGTFEEVAARAGVEAHRPVVLQGLHLDRLRQRPLPRPVPQLT